MGSKYATVAISGFNSSPPSDDGSTAASNQATWAGIKTKLADPVKTAVETINSELVTALDQSARSITGNDSAIASDHDRTIQVASTISPAITVTLSDAATMAAGYVVTISNQSATYATTIARTGSDTIDGVASNLTLPPLSSVRFKVNASANGYLKDGDDRSMTLLDIKTASTSSSLSFTGLTGYAGYIFDLDLVRPATDAVALHMLISTDNGATYKTGGSDYAYENATLTAGSAAAISSAGAAQIVIAGNSIGNNAGFGVNGRVSVNGLAAAKLKPFKWGLGFMTSTTTLVNVDGAGIYIGASTAINAVLFKASSGNLADGKIRCYGVRG